MPIRFKFRSSVAYDSIDLGGRSSISVLELRDKIVAHKKLQLCNDFELLISDAETGKALDDEGIQVMEGSSVVIKRVPAGLSGPRDLNVGSVARNNVGNIERVAPAPPPPPPLPPQNVGEDNYDDFGTELFPCIQGSLPESGPESDADSGNLKFTANEKDNVVPRCSETSLSRNQKIGGTDLCEALSEEVIGDNCCKESNIGRTQKHMKLDSKKEVHPKLDQQTVIPLPTMLDMDLPAELRCSLCSAIFKDAVMIRCCQHSFCETCIRTALLERGRCPKCSSMQYTVETLLPNLSLRQAIEHFLDAQAVNNALQNKIPQDIPDVESGIHVKEVSCAVSIRKNEPPYPHSSLATRRLSDQVAGGMGKSAPSPLMIKHLKEDENSSAAAWNRMAGFQGVQSSSKLPQNFLQEEVNMSVPTNKGIGVTVIDGSGTLIPSSRHRKGDRNCYMCGSPDHLIRDCPAGSNSYPFNQTGDAAFAGGMPMYGQAYWHGNTFPQARPYGNIYGNQGMMPFDPTMAPISPFGIPPYMSCMYNGMPGTYGYTRMGGGRPPMAPGMERPLPRQAFVEPQDGKLKHKTLNGEQDFDNRPKDYYYKGSRTTSHEGRHQLDKVTTGSFSDDDSPRIHKKHPDNKHYSSSHRKPTIQSDEELPSAERGHERGSHQSISGRDQLSRHSEKSNSEAQDLSDSSNRHGRDRKRDHHGICVKKQSERRGHHASEFSPKSQHRTRKDISDDEKVASNHKRHSHRRHPESSFEPNFAGARRQHHKEKEAGHGSRSSRQIPKSKDNRSEYESWEMKEGLGDEYGGENHHKRQRTR